MGQGVKQTPIYMTQQPSEADKHSQHIRQTLTPLLNARLEVSQH
jgi:hypothetical protein